MHASSILHSNNQRLAKLCRNSFEFNLCFALTATDYFIIVMKLVHPNYTRNAINVCSCLLVDFTYRHVYILCIKVTRLQMCAIYTKPLTICASLNVYYTKVYFIQINICKSNQFTLGALQHSRKQNCHLPLQTFLNICSICSMSNMAKVISGQESTQTYFDCDKKTYVASDFLKF